MESEYLQSPKSDEEACTKSQEKGILHAAAWLG
jgi:hypothetical protein